MRIEKLKKKKEVLFEEHSKDYVLVRTKIINKIRLLYLCYFIYTNDNYIL
ncbi:hypothetical protein [Anaerococcus rubeinfantis]|nr:hypothetical protein [Anaerococcus rubeinfantis]